MNTTPPTDEDRWIYKAKLIRVVDGDTVVLAISVGLDWECKHRYCRLLGMNAPEVVGSEKAAGNAATEHLRSLLSQADPLLIRTEMDEVGSFRRLLVELWDGDACINQRMIGDGFAEPRD